MIERVKNKYDTKQDVFIRIHEMQDLDHKDEQLGFIYMTGTHVDSQKNACDDMNAPFEIFEDVKSLTFTVTDKCDAHTAKFVHILAQAYKEKYPGLTVAQGDYANLQVKAHEERQTRRCDYKIEEYSPNHEIVNAEIIWEKKKRDDLDRPIENSDDLCLYRTLEEEGKPRQENMAQDI